MDTNKLVCTFCELSIKTGVNRVVADMSSYLGDNLLIFTPKYNPNEVYELNSRVVEVNLYNIWKISRIIKKEKRDVILNPHHFHTIFPFALVKLLLSKNTRLSPFIYDPEELEVSFPKISEIIRYPKIIFLKILFIRTFISTIRYPQILLKILLVRACIKLKLVDEILVLGDNMAELVKNKLNCKNVEIVRIGVSPSFVESTTKVNLEPSERIRKIINNKHGVKIFFQGILIPRRRLEDLIEAIRLLKDNMEIFLFVGGSLKIDIYYVNYIKELIDKFNLNNSIYLLGSLSENELNYLYNICDIFVFPCNNQSWGLAPLEAMFFEKPVIVSTGCGVTEILNKEVAMLVPPMNSLAIKNAIINLVNDNDLKKGIKNNAREYVLKEYTFSNTMSKLKELWKI